MYEGSWLPYHSIISGEVSIAQYKLLFDSERRIELGKELVRGACRLRCLVAGNWFPREKENGRAFILRS